MFAAEYSRRLAARGGRAIPPSPDLTTSGSKANEARGARVLIVEDNWLVAVEMETTLTDAGYVVVGIAVSAVEAVTLCEAKRPDFVLMDIRLQGGSDGIEASVEIRTRFNVPSIFVSAHDDAKTRGRAALAAPLGWIVKPVVGPVLIERIRRLRAPMEPS